MAGGDNPGRPRILVFGGTGTIGRAAVAALVARGHEVVCFARPRAGVGGGLTRDGTARLLQGAEVRFGDVTDPQSLAEQGFCDQRFDAVLSCMASATESPGTPGLSTTRHI